MKKLHRTILLGIPGPFFAALGTLIFLLVLQFLMVHMKQLVGRGLPITAIMELISYSLAYMISLAVPMSALLAVLVVFGRLAESQAYAVVKSSGISLIRLAWPVLIVGIGLVGMMTYFNGVMLPEANHRMRALWNDIRSSKPGFELQPGVFYDGLQGYTIRVQEAPAESNHLEGILLFDHSGSGLTTIVAQEGELQAHSSVDIGMTLRHGEIHRMAGVRDRRGRVERYERITFEQHRLSFDASDLTFERSGATSSSRTGRTMRNSQLLAAYDSVLADVDRRRMTGLKRILYSLENLSPSAPMFVSEPVQQDSLTEHLPELLTIAPGGARRTVETTSEPEHEPALRVPPERSSQLLQELDESQQEIVLDNAINQARNNRTDISATASTAGWELMRANRYVVEFYKKHVMALACFVFVLVGIPLGLMVRRRGYGTAITISVGIFLFYWFTLVQGEKFADRNLIDPAIAMWAPSIFGGIMALLFFIRESRLPSGFSLRLRRR